MIDKPLYLGDFPKLDFSKQTLTGFEKYDNFASAQINSHYNLTRKCGLDTLFVVDGATPHILPFIVGAQSRNTDVTIGAFVTGIHKDTIAEDRTVSVAKGLGINSNKELCELFTKRSSVHPDILFFLQPTHHNNQMTSREMSDMTSKIAKGYERVVVVMEDYAGLPDATIINPTVDGAWHSLINEMNARGTKLERYGFHKEAQENTINFISPYRDINNLATQDNKFSIGEITRRYM